MSGSRSSSSQRLFSKLPWPATDGSGGSGLLELAGNRSYRDWESPPRVSRVAAIAWRLLALVSCSVKRAVAAVAGFLRSRRIPTPGIGGDLGDSGNCAGTSCHSAASMSWVELLLGMQPRRLGPPESQDQMACRIAGHRLWSRTAGGTDGYSVPGSDLAGGVVGIGQIHPFRARPGPDMTTRIGHAGVLAAAGPGRDSGHGRLDRVRPCAEPRVNLVKQCNVRPRPRLPPEHLRGYGRLRRLSRPHDDPWHPRLRPVRSANGFWEP